MDSRVQAQTTAIQCEEQPAYHLLRTEKSIPMTRHQGGKGNIYCFLDVEMTFLWNWILPGVCGNLEKGIIISTSSGLVGNLLLGRVCPPQAWGCRRNSHSTGPSTSAVNKTECMIPELVKICFIIAFPRMYFRESLGYFTLPWVSPQDGSFC